MAATNIDAESVWTQLKYKSYVKICTYHYNLLNFAKLDMSGPPAFEVDTKITNLSSGQVLFSRQL